MSSDPTIFCLDCGYPLDGLTQTACPECGRAFDATDGTSFAVDRGSLVKLYVSGNSVDVYILRDTLLDAGIMSVVMGETLGAGRGDLPLTADTLPSLWVGQLDVAPHMPIAAAYDTEAVDEQSGVWKCPECGEEIEGNFAVCWNCECERPA